MPVGDEVEESYLVLQLDPVVEGADEVSEMQFPGRAHPDTTRCFATSFPTGIGRYLRPLGDSRAQSGWRAAAGPVDSIPVSINAYNQEAPGTQLFDDGASDLRKDAHQHVAAVQRRHGIMLKTASSTFDRE